MRILGIVLLVLALSGCTAMMLGGSAQPPPTECSKDGQKENKSEC